LSIGLGLAEVMAPRALARVIGVSGERSLLLRLFGLREMAERRWHPHATSTRSVDVGACWG